MTNPNTKAALGTVTQGPLDAYNDPTTTVVWTLHDAIWWPGGSSESVNGQDQVTWQNTICFHTGTVVSATDVVIPVVTVGSSGNVLYAGDGTTPQGDQYAVNGQPSVWPANSAAWRHPYSVVVALTRTVG